MPLDVDRLADTMLAGAQALIAKAVAPLIAANEGLSARNADLEARLVVVEEREMPPAIDPDAITGLQQGLAAAVAAIEAREVPDVAAAVQEAVIAAVAGLEPPAVPDVAPMVEAAVRAAVEALPVPQDGKDADPAELAELRAVVDAVAKAVEDLPPPPVPQLPDLSGFATKEDLAVVRAAIPDVPASPDLSGLATKAEVEAVRALIPAAGAGIADVKQNADGELVVKLTTGETFNVGKVRGADGLGFDDMSVDWDGERLLTFAFIRDGRTEATSLKIPAMIDRGVWREGEFECGDAVTWGGSLWLAQRDTTDKPETSDAWRLAVKRGRDGKDLRPNEDGPRGPIRVGNPAR